MRDQNEVISSIDTKVNYSSVNSFKGLTFGAVRGRVIKPLDTAFLTNDIVRVDVHNEEQLLQLLRRNRVDVVTLPKTIAIPMIKKLNIEENIFISPTPIYTYSRHIMLTSDLKEVHGYLTEVVRNLSTDPRWKAILLKYNLDV